MSSTCIQIATQAPNKTPPATVASAASTGAEICNGRRLAAAAFLEKKIVSFSSAIICLTFGAYPEPDVALDAREVATV